MITIDKIGKRICIIGCSNAGKSTLADALSRKLNIPAYHLDQLAHIENSKWARKPDEMLIEKHNVIIQQDTWVIDGNYSVCMKKRLDLATCVIWLDPNVYSSVFRYLSRSFKSDPNRPGGLQGAKKEFGFWLIKWILFNYPKNRKKYKKMLADKPNLPVLHIGSMKLLKKYYDLWGVDIERDD